MAAVNYKVLKNFFTQEELNVLQRYCYNKLDLNKNYRIDMQSFSPSWYNDPLMTAILDTKLSVIEKEINLKLYPTYAYWRYYIFGATLEKHTDNSACEISISACIKKYDNWPFIIEADSFELNEGDAIIYAGCDHKHGRPGVYKGEGIAQVFLHYVNQQGKNKHHAYNAIYKETRSVG